MRKVSVPGSHSSGLLSALRKGGRPDPRAPVAAQTLTGPPQSGKPPSPLLSPPSAWDQGQWAEGDRTSLPPVLAPRSGHGNRTTAAAVHGPSRCEGSRVSTQAGACLNRNGSAGQAGS